jgi:hypothetical protein
MVRTVYPLKRYTNSGALWAMALAYFINRKQTTCVISLSGSISNKDKEVLEQCLKEAMTEPCLHFIVNMGGIREMDPEGSRPFAHFQQGLRAKSKLYLCNLQIETSTLLKMLGILSDGENFVDLLSCLEAILALDEGKPKK